MSVPPVNLPQLLGKVLIDHVPHHLLAKQAATLNHLRFYGHLLYKIVKIPLREQPIFIDIIPVCGDERASLAWHGDGHEPWLREQSQQCEPECVSIDMMMASEDKIIWNYRRRYCSTYIVQKYLRILGWPFQGNNKVIDDDGVDDDDDVDDNDTSTRMRTA